MRDALEQWGLTALWHTDIDATRLQVVPLFPTDDGASDARYRGLQWSVRGANFQRRAPVNTVRELPGYVDLHNVQVDTPDVNNLPGAYVAREIQAYTRSLYNTQEQPLRVTQGTTKPTIYSDVLNSVPVTLYDFYVQRWRLGLNSRSLKLDHKPIVDFYLRDRHVLMYDLLEWLVTGVSHSWNDREGYTQSISMTLRQPVVASLGHTAIGD